MIIFIAGPSGVGKTQLAKYLLKKIQEQGIEAALISMDDYCKDIPERYDLALMSTLPNNDKTYAENDMIYLSEDGKYVVRDLDGVVQEGIFNTEEMDLSQLQTSLKNSDFKSAVLKVTSKAGYTLSEKLALEDYQKTTNFDTPDILRLDLLKEDVEKWLKNEPIAKPIFDAKLEKCVGYKPVVPSDILIVEGIFALHFVQHYLQHLDPEILVNVFIETDNYNTIINRRVHRAFLHQNSHHIKQKEKESVGPAFFRVISRTRHFADYIIDNSKECLDSPESNSHILYTEAKVILAKVERYLEEKNALSYRP